MKYTTQRPYAASYVIVKNDEGKIAFVLRANTDWNNNYYGLPAGKTENNETFTEGAIREAKEEIGIDVKPEDLKHAITVHRYTKESHHDMAQWVDVFFEVQKYFGEVHNAEPHMHSKVEWIDPNQLPEKIVPPVKPAIEAYLKGKKYIEYGWDDVERS